MLEAQGGVIGLIEREELYSQFSQPPWFDVCNRRPTAPLVTRAAMAVDGTMPIGGVKWLIAYCHPQAISSGFAIVEQGRCPGIGTMTAPLEKTVDLAHLRAIELEDAGRKAETASEAKPCVVAAMRHERRTPLDAIIGFAALLPMRDAAQVEQRHATSPTSGTRVRTILDYPKVAADHLPLSETVFHLAGSCMTASA